MIDSRGVLEFENRFWSNFDQPIVERHRQALRLVEAEPVLDVGGGDGLFCDLLAQQRGLKELTVMDLSPVAVDKARKRGLKADLLDLARPLPFPDRSFGTVCALDVLEHVYDPRSVLNELARVGRSVVISVPNFHYAKDRLSMVLGQVPFQSRPKRGHVYWFNYGVLCEMVAGCDLRVDRLVCTTFKRFGPVGPWLANVHPNLFADGFVVRLTPNA